jgi:hypothetical protein
MMFVPSRKGNHHTLPWAIADGLGGPRGTRVVQFFPKGHPERRTYLDQTGALVVRILVQPHTFYVIASCLRVIDPYLGHRYHLARWGLEKAARPSLDEILATARPYDPERD